MRGSYYSFKIFIILALVIAILGIRDRGGGSCTSTDDCMMGWCFGSTCACNDIHSIGEFCDECENGYDYEQEKNECVENGELKEYERYTAIVCLFLCITCTCCIATIVSSKRKRGRNRLDDEDEPIEVSLVDQTVDEDINDIPLGTVTVRKAIRTFGINNESIFSKFESGMDQTRHLWYVQPDDNVSIPSSSRSQNRTNNNSNNNEEIEDQEGVVSYDQGIVHRTAEERKEEMNINNNNMYHPKDCIPFFLYHLRQRSFDRVVGDILGSDLSSSSSPNSNNTSWEKFATFLARWKPEVFVEEVSSFLEIKRKSSATAMASDNIVHAPDIRFLQPFDNDVMSLGSSVNNDDNVKSK